MKRWRGIPVYTVQIQKQVQKGQAKPDFHTAKQVIFIYTYTYKLHQFIVGANPNVYQVKNALAKKIKKSREDATKDLITDKPKINILTKCTSVNFTKTFAFPKISP